MKGKAKGGWRERQVRDFLLQKGYKVCKAGGSLGEWDLIAVNNHVFLLVQVKSNRFCYPAERALLEMFKAPLNAYKLQAQAADRKGIAFRLFQEGGGWLNVTTFNGTGVTTGEEAVWFKAPARKELAL